MSKIFNSVFVNYLTSVGDYFFGNHFMNSIKEWNRYDLLSEQELEDIQQKRLKKMLQHAIETVPYYQKIKLPDTAGNSLTDFPVLTKEMLRFEKENLVSNRYNTATLKKNFSSGSSGIQSYSYTTKGFSYYNQGLQNHWYLWSGFKIGDGVVQFGISPNRAFPKNIKDVLFNVHYVNSFSISEPEMIELAELIRKKNIKYIIGYPSAINEFTKVVLKHGFSLSLNAIITLGDKLFAHFKKNFELAFSNPKIIDTYGCAEGLLMACSNDTAYYNIMSPNVFIEIVDDANKPVPDGELGHVLVTSLTNFAQPMIRYKLGDLAIKLPKEKYPEKRLFNYPLLEKIVGRETDVVITPNQKKLIVHSFTGIVEYYPEIKQYKIIQEVPESIIFEYITDSNFDFSEKTLQEIKSKIDVLTDNSISVEFKAVDYIASTPSGKPQIIESKIK
ncbi:AMP-binding protein [Flavobacterium sp. UBA6135]|uniref:AMP-binding protein n=1 Tax=Flavobacterium sp. UBA6135 TaxID=1946553 RepID=UPI0025B8B6DF|nr:AMP-binding protein [Flavobacterium sp. UBA6135]